MPDHPWKEIVPPRNEGELAARRVDAHGRWDFFWALDHEGASLLVLQHSSDTPVPPKLPRLRGIHVFELMPPGKPPLLALRLADSTQRDVFERLCRDIVETCASATSEAHAVRTAIHRTWHWHHLLRGGGDGRLTAEEQKGLIGELLTLEHLLLPIMEASDAVAAWVGPLDAPKDFEIGPVAIEAKAHSMGGSPFVTISSEHQLDDDGLKGLFLHVVDVGAAPAAEPNGESVLQVAQRVRSLINQKDPSPLDHFDSLILAAGLRWDDDYSDLRWLVGTRLLFAVSSTFPRITSKVPAGVSHVRYSLSILDCDPFRVPDTALFDALKGGGLDVD